MVNWASPCYAPGLAVLAPGSPVQEVHGCGMYCQDGWHGLLVYTQEEGRLPRDYFNDVLPGQEVEFVHALRAAELSPLETDGADSRPFRAFLVRWRPAPTRQPGLLGRLTRILSFVRLAQRSGCA